jgi:WD40 repeat protein
LSSLRMWDSNDESETSIEHIDTVLELSYKSAVLGIAISAKKDLLATSTKDGQVHVYNLNQLKNELPTTTQLVWDTIRSGAVRCVFFSLDGSELGFGGYDKTVVFVETEFWTCSRQLNMSGTVSCGKFPSNFVNWIRFPHTISLLPDQYNLFGSTESLSWSWMSRQILHFI